VHRDIKPENVLISGGHAVLADFGIAAVTASESRGSSGERLTEVGMSMGTPGYMSPEQATGEPLDGRSDLYSLAVIGYEMLTGQPPFVGPSPMSVITKHLTEAPPNVNSLRADVPAPLASALAKALAKQPAARFQKAQDFREALGERYAKVNTPLLPRWAMAAAALVLVVIVALGVFLRQRGAGSESLDANLIAVAPFDVFDENYAMWREGLVDVLAANLDGAGPLRSVSPATAIRRWKGGTAARTTASEFGKGLNAGIVVFGRVLGAGRDSVRIEASLMDASTDRLIGEVQVRDDISRMDRIADSLSLRILGELGQSRAIALVRRSAIGSTSVPAIKAYLQGAQFYRRSAWDSATVYLERAAGLDSNFAPALRLLANAISWQTTTLGQRREDITPIALRAGANNVGLAPRESLLVASDSMFVALTRRQTTAPPAVDMYVLAERMFDILERGTQRFSDDAEIWFKLGDARFHFGFLHPSKQTLEQTRAAFDRAVELDSAFTPSYIHLVQVLNQLQDVPAMRAAMRNFLALEPGGEQADGLRLAEKLLDPATPRDDRSLGAIFAAADQRAIRNAYNTLLFLNDTTETQVVIARVMRGGIESMRVPPQFVSQARFAMAQGLVARGHIREAAAGAPNNPAVLVQAGLVGILPADSVDRVMARAATQMNDLTIAPLIHWATFRGDAVLAARIVDTFRRSERAFFPPAMGAGVVALAKHDTAGAISALTMPDSVCLTWCPMARFYLGRLLAATGKDADAASVLDQNFPGIDVAKVLWMLERGRVNQRLGNRAKAIDSYAYVTTAWQNPDDELKALVEEARRGLAALSSDPSSR
jgi:serine/threonine-protein kinase